VDRVAAQVPGHGLAHCEVDGAVASEIEDRSKLEPAFGFRVIGDVPRGSLAGGEVLTDEIEKGRSR